MNVKNISRTVGLILLITGIFQLFPLLIAVIDHEPRNILAYIESLCLILLVGSALLLFSRGGNRMFSCAGGLCRNGSFVDFYVRVRRTAVLFKRPDPELRRCVF